MLIASLCSFSGFTGMPASTPADIAIAWTLTLTHGTDDDQPPTDGKALDALVEHVPAHALVDEVDALWILFPEHLDSSSKLALLLGVPAALLQALSTLAPRGSTGSPCSAAPSCS